MISLRRTFQDLKSDERVSIDMAGQDNVKKGRLENGNLDVENTRDKRAAWDIALDGDSSATFRGDNAPSPAERSPNQEQTAPSALDDGGDAETQLYAYLERMRAPRPKGFPPMDELTSRLGEFSLPYTAEAAHSEPHARAGAASAPRQTAELAWFEQKFTELKSAFARQEADKSEIVSINEKLAEIIARVDRLADAMPGEQTMVAVETKLQDLSRSLDATRKQTASDAERIARAAKEILAATGRAEVARQGFEAAARHTVKELGQTVAVAASRAAVVTAEHIAAALHETGDVGGIGRVENELRALNAQSRETGDRTAAALERVHDTLRMFLERDQLGERIHAGITAPPASTPAPAQKRRAGVHMPIASGAPAYTRPDAEFGTEPTQKPQLGSITSRSAPRTDANLLRSLEDADRRMSAGGYQAGADGDAKQPQPTSKAPLFSDDDKTLPLIGLSIVAIVLLIASAVLYYLHSQAKRPAAQLPVSEQTDIALTATPPETQPLLAPKTSNANAQHRAAASKSAGTTHFLPSLLSASDQDGEPLKNEDLQELTNAASRGDREAQFRIASRFLREENGQSDPATASRWLARAAEQGHAESQFVLASLYERGAGVPKNEDQAVGLYRRAAAVGHVRAMHNLAVLLTAHETPEDYKQAAALFTAAAQAGVTDSQFNLALLYERGLGLAKDYQKAFFWYEVASREGDKDAIRAAERVKHLLTAAEMQAAQEKAGTWQPLVQQSPRVANGAGRG
ncbi:sel1 repeat family protein [Rhodomicrobium vannielii ATCC 17100]|uniref:tetratricopeptide repeat protein n=1 Tax=Rhodomicrobium vannielii TaxID=1069 RepID=UPI0019184916|nr:sel1 repeat family protein [Rhodomicrobium vannielii ATCC 17100]